MGIAMEATLRSGRPGYDKLLQDFSPDDCGDCRGVIKRLKVTSPLAHVMVNHLPYDRTSHRVEGRFILD
jgi:hypothetical protein